MGAAMALLALDLVRDGVIADLIRPAAEPRRDDGVMRGTRSLLATALIVAAPAVVVADAEPASAHGIGGREPTNVRVVCLPSNRQSPVST